MHSMPTATSLSYNDKTSRDKQAREMIVSATARASTLAALPIPWIDTVGVGIVQLVMIEQLSVLHHGERVDRAKVAVNIGATAAVAALITATLSRTAVLVNLDGVLSDNMIEATVSGITTEITGDIYNRCLAEGLSAGDVSLDQYLEYLSEKVQTADFDMSSLVQKGLMKLA